MSKVVSPGMKKVGAKITGDPDLAVQVYEVMHARYIYELPVDVETRPDGTVVTRTMFGDRLKAHKKELEKFASS